MIIVFFYKKLGTLKSTNETSTCCVKKNPKVYFYFHKIWYGCCFQQLLICFFNVIVCLWHKLFRCFLSWLYFYGFKLNKGKNCLTDKRPNLPKKFYCHVKNWHFLKSHTKLIKKNFITQLLITGSWVILYLQNYHSALMKR